LDWWHISMRVQHIEQALRGVYALEPRHRAGLEIVDWRIGRLRHLIWNGYHQEAHGELFGMRHMASEVAYLNGEKFLPAASSRQRERSALLLHRNMWDTTSVKLWPVLFRLLSILAVASLLIAPMAAPSLAMAAAPAGAMEDIASMSDGMPCSHEKPALPDCPKSCPFAALCMTGSLSYAPESGPSIPARFAVADVKSPGDDVEPERLTEPPSPRPPRT
jgi:hypothetical protein